MSRRVIPGLEAPDAALEADIRARLDQVEQALEKSVRVESSGLLSETSSYLIAAGGKRFRAMLVLLAGYFGDPTDPRLIGGSVSIELVHLATLYHDDVIDEADSRRGAPVGQHALGQHRRDPLRATSCSPGPPRSRPSWAPTCAGCWLARSPSSATARSARSTAPRRSNSQRATTWRSSAARPPR